MSGSNPNSSILGTQPSDRRPMVSKTPKERYLSGRNDSSSNPIEQENVQGNEEVIVSPEDAPKGIKPIGCKWVYKRKRGVDVKVETVKARLVAKDFIQREGIVYEETFSSVAMLKSIRTLLSIAAHYDYEVWQMDVKTDFLNGHLEECISMVQPDGFVERGHESKVC
ncbi:cysteine-rich RLK (RECEPTOR-like protein kinase) 8 [Abeliophyllum distichum]|uniref:Cysteine-rich RLK (RECEPTOR-like protein kinase) 8 n=1 Tax=Abeliophyllum distichum TaxID=126358 RepID=A0ABD1QEJ9_9LAMI